MKRGGHAHGLRPLRPWVETPVTGASHRLVLCHGQSRVERLRSTLLCCRRGAALRAKWHACAFHLPSPRTVFARHARLEDVAMTQHSPWARINRRSTNWWCPGPVGGDGGGSARICRGPSVHCPECATWQDGPRRMWNPVEGKKCTTWKAVRRKPLPSSRGPT